MVEQSPKGPSTMEDYLRWRASRDQEYLVSELAKPKGSTPRQKFFQKKLAPSWSALYKV